MEPGLEKEGPLKQCADLPWCTYQDPEYFVPLSGGACGAAAGVTGKGGRGVHAGRPGARGARGEGVPRSFRGRVAGRGPAPHPRSLGGPVCPERAAPGRHSRRALLAPRCRQAGARSLTLFVIPVLLQVTPSESYTPVVWGCHSLVMQFFKSRGLHRTSQGTR